MIEQGKVYWITGLSGAGKTTIAKKLWENKRKRKNNVILLDGDVLRQTIANDLGYSNDDRLKAGYRYAKLCMILADQGINVIIATVAMYHEIREWNRLNIKNYKEIYLKVPMEVLEKRNQKKLYSRGKAGIEKNIMGIDLVVEEPLNPDLVIINDGRHTIETCTNMILKI